MNLWKLFMASTYVIISRASLVLFFLLAYDILVTICFVDGNMFCSDWDRIFNIKSGFGHALSMIAFMFMSMVASASAIDLCHNMKNDAVHATGDGGSK